MSFPTPNNDEGFKPQSSLDDALFIGNFHKTLPHNEFGEVDATAYRQFERTCVQIEAGAPLNFENVPKGSLTPTTFDPGTPNDLKTVAKFTSPLAGAATEGLGPDPKNIEMPPAPGIRSLSTAAELVELYWMALLRDEPIADFSSITLHDAVKDIKKAFEKALDGDTAEGAVKLGLDLPRDSNGKLDIRDETLFRSGLQDEEFGPLVSQFFLHNTPYGVQTIDATQIPYAAGRNYLTAYDDWLRAQNTGKDKFGRDYASCNFFADDPGYYNTANPRKIATMRDLARFVNRDALHQAYFNAALFLDAVGAPLDDGNPYKGVRYSREGGFATLGGPDLLTVVSEVASRALKVVWRQKWLVHRRARPEVYAGLLEMQTNGLNGTKRKYGIPDLAVNSEAGKRILQSNKLANGGPQGTYFLPMAFTAGSPTHPAYGAGHATVAGACVTVLKAWFDETASLQAVFDNSNNDPKHNHKEPRKPGFKYELLKPAKRTAPDTYGNPDPYTGGDKAKLTVGGELNKIASNVAMGRSMGGVHWRTDNTRSLRVGEQVAIEILRKRTLQYAERPLSFTFRSFDRQIVRISQGQVSIE